ncbi:MAG TPA: acyltransferase family protein [Allosphingosinicella sp.]
MDRTDGAGAGPAGPPTGAPTALGYVPAIDGLRAVAILSVLVFHLRPFRLPGGFAGVDVFFVISGFVVTASLIDLRFERLRDLLGHFYVRRILRIVPALAVMLVVTSILCVLFIPSFGLLGRTGTGLAAFAGVSNIVLAWTGIGYFGGGADLDPFLHTWTLGVEEQFYLLFPFLFFFCRAGLADPARSGRGLAIIAAATLASLGFCAWLSAIRWEYAFYLMPARFWELGTGMLLCLTMARWRPALAKATNRPISLFGWACAILLLTFLLVDSSARSPFPALLVPVAATAGLIALVCAQPGHALARILALPPAVFVGTISYSLYLWHWPVFTMFRWTVGLEGKANGFAAIALSLALAVASWALVERPFRARRHEARRSRLRPALALLALLAVFGGVSAGLLWNQRRLSPSVSDRSLVWDGRQRRGRCAADETDRRIASARVYSFTPDCAPAPEGRRLIVVGDSHALAYRTLFKTFASETRMPVLVYGQLGCDYPSLRSPMGGNRNCSKFYREVEAVLGSTLGPGDVLFMPALRVHRLVDSSGLPVSDRWRAGPDLNRNVEAEAGEVLKRLAATGATLILEAPKPVFPIAPFRCSDWFNRSNPSCRSGWDVSRPVAERHRARTVAAMARLRSAVPALLTWDPMLVLCTPSVCSARRDGTALYHDGDHVTGFANDLLYPDFRDFVARASVRPKAASRSVPASWPGRHLTDRHAEPVSASGIDPLR